MINWPSNVNKKIRRDGSEWQESTGFIADKTMSGKSKRRPAGMSAPRIFSVTFIFSYDEYRLFKAWYENETLKGFVSFKFPTIDLKGVSEFSEYRFSDNGAPKYSSKGGDNISASMIWEEVRNNVN